MRKLTLVLVVAGLLAGTGWLHSPAHAQDRAGQIIAMVNSLRAANGLPGYAPEASLMAAAQAQASWMANTGQYGHTGEGGSSPQNRADASGYNGYVMENYVLGTGMSPSEAITWWDNSPIHHRTMLAQSGYTHVGAGTAVRDRMIIYVLVVGKPRNAPPSSSSASEPEEAEPVRIVVPVTRSEPREDGSIVHVVQQGQTLWDIAAVYEVDLGEMLWINNKKVGDIVKPGDEIIVRLAEGQLPPPTPTPPNFHTVQQGDSLWSIAAQYRIDFEQMLLINGMEVGDIVKPGDEIILFLRPGETPPPTPTPPLYHTVRAGQTVWEIAVSNGLTVDELLALNNMQRPAIIKEGDELLIRAIDPTPTPTPEPPAAPESVAESVPESAPEPTDTAIVPSAPTMPPPPAPETQNPAAGAEMDAAPATTEPTASAVIVASVTSTPTAPATTAAAAQPSSAGVTSTPTVTATGTSAGVAAAVVPSQTATPRPTQAVSAITNTAATTTDPDADENSGLILGLIAAGVILLAGLAIGVAIYYLK